MGSYSCDPWCKSSRYLRSIRWLTISAALENSEIKETSLEILVRDAVFVAVRDNVLGELAQPRSLIPAE